MRKERRERMGRPSIAEQRRIEIGRALQTCMIRSGSYRLTSVKDIAQEANVATGLIHHYFESKDEILYMMADLSLIALSNSVEELMHTKTQEQRQARLNEMFNDVNNSFLFNLYFLAASMPEVRKMIEDWREELEAYLLVRIRRNEKYSDNAQECVDRFTYLLESGIIYTSVFENKQARELLEQALDEYFPLG
ncbi:MAG: TetR/AcrR family transcriptional regulator [Solobacterium sp.]|nr:TetR/AcrR family transcriptional regulator [Solobacterium sp.]